MAYTEKMKPTIEFRATKRGRPSAKNKEAIDAIAELARRRKLHAERMARYRAKLKERKNAKHIPKAG